MIYLRTFDNHAAYDAAESGLLLPNVSLCVNENEVHYKPLIKVSGISLNKAVLELKGRGATETLIATVAPSDASNKAVTWSSSNESVATVSNNGLVTAVGIVGSSATITVTTVDGGFTAQCESNIIDPYAGHAYVDLGLPSGTKWATMNVGATRVTDYGNYYQYGKGAAQYSVTSGDSMYDGEENPLATSADTAAQVWGGSWHIPTLTQFEELTANTICTATVVQRKSLMKFTAQNGNYVLFPLSGFYIDGGISNFENDVYLWTSSPVNSNSSYYANIWYLGEGEEGDQGVLRIRTRGRDAGLSIRPVV